MINNFVDGRTGAKGFFDKKADNVVIQGNTSFHTTMLTSDGPRGANDRLPFLWFISR